VLLSSHPEVSSDPEVVAASRPDRQGREGNTGSFRILYLNWRDIRNPEAGGAEIFTHEVTRRWVERGHHVTLLTSGFSRARPAETIDGVRVRRIGRLRNGSFHALVQWELARQSDFDFVIEGVNGIPFLTPLWRRRLPPKIALVYQLGREVWDYELPSGLATIVRWMEPRLMRPYRDVPVVTISDSGAAELRRIGLANLFVIEPGCDPPPELGVTEKEPAPTVLFVGRLAANKRPDHAIECYRHIKASVPRARLWLVGRGPLEERLASSIPEGVDILGHLSRSDLYRRMATAHCLLVPSVREGWGLVVIEANSVGTPAVGYDVPGIRDSIQHERTGLLSAAGDPRELARQALSLLTDPDRYAVIRRAAQSRAASFSWDRTAELLLGLVESHVSTPSR
jgi:glycosyltransferase involved in cell wall biosynthesis